MSFLRKMSRERRAISYQDVFGQGGDWVEASGLMSQEKALQLSAVWGCVGVISNAISTAPLQVFREQGEANVRVRPTPTFCTNPSNEVDLVTWLVQGLTSYLLRGNGYGLITELGSNGWPEKAEWIHPDRVALSDRDRAKRGQWHYIVDGRDVVERWQMLHVRGLTLPGSRLGLSPIAAAKVALSLGESAESFAEKFFTQGGHPTAILSTDQQIEKGTAEVIKARFIEATRGRREPAVLGAGLKYEAIQIAPEEAQFLETQQASIGQIARFFGIMDASMIGGDSGGSLTYANVEQRYIEFKALTLNPIAIRFERAISDCLVNMQYARFNLDASARTSLLDRYKAHDMAIRTGWRSINEIRALEELPPVPEGDEYLWPPYTTTEPLPQGQQRTESEGTNDQSS